MTSRMTLTTVTLPAHWASALINHDFSALDEDERVHVESEVAKLAQAGWAVVSTDGDEPRFTWHYPLYHPGGVAQGGEVLDYIIARQEGGLHR